MEISMDAVLHRLEVCERDIDALSARINKADVSQAQTNIKLDNMLVTLGELKESVNAIKERPGTFWDKVIYALIGAVVSASVSIAINGGM